MHDTMKKKRNINTREQM